MTEPVWIPKTKTDWAAVGMLLSFAGGVGFGLLSVWEPALQSVATMLFGVFGAALGFFTRDRQQR